MAPHWSALVLLMYAAGTAAWGSPRALSMVFPAAFEANTGQTDPGVDFVFRGAVGTGFLTPHGLTVRAGAAHWSMALVGSRHPHPGVGMEPQAARSQYFYGQRWHTAVPRFSRVRYTGVYPGVNVIYSATGSRLEYDFIVAPGADPQRIELAFSNVRDLRVNASGELVLRTPGGTVRQPPPRLYQPLAGGRQSVAGGYRVGHDRHVRFMIGRYDRSQPLVIDPVLSYATEFGGSRMDAATSVAVDASGCAYVAGWTESVDFPVTNARQPASQGSVDAFVLKLSPDGGSVVYATYLGGRGDDRALGIAVNAAGEAVVTGYTYSTDFPVVNAVQGGLSGGRDAFAAKLSASGGALLFSTYVGGRGADTGRAVALDTAANIYVVGETDSPQFPTRTAFQNALAGLQDAFIVKLDSSGALVYGTYLGGSGNDRAAGIAVDSGGSAYITGSTDSRNFPTPHALQSVNAGGQDAFVAKLGAAGDQLLYSTYLGGSGGTIGFPETGNAIAVDREGNAYVAGVTSSADFPHTAAFQAAFAGGGADAFVVKLNSSGTSLVYGTYLGGSGIDVATAVAVADSGAAIVAGYTTSVNFPNASALQYSHGGSYDAFVARLAPGGNALEFATYMGGQDSDAAYGVVLGAAGDIYVAGQTFSQNFPVRGGAQGMSPDSYAAFVARIGVAMPAPVSVTAPARAGDPFLIAFSDSAGSAALTWVQMLINAGLNGRNACWIQYYQPGNLMMLVNDEATGGQGATAPGTAAAIRNSQCTLAVGGSSVSRSGNTLTLAVSLAFSSGFTGTKDAYLIADDAGGSSGWRHMATFTAAGSGPAPVSFSTAGSGVLVFTFGDSSGYQDLTWMHALINASLAGPGACWLQYYRPANLLMLVNDAGTAGMGAAPPGSPGTIRNAQCTVDLAGASVTASGNNLVLSVPITFNTSFSGTKYVYMVADDTAGSSGWRQMATFTAAAPGPSPVSFRVNLPSTLVFTFAHSGGYTNLTWVQALINSSLNTDGACWIQYYRPGNLLTLVNDGGTGGIRAAPPGSAGTIQNSRCTVNLAEASVAVSGNNLVLSVPVTFASGYSGTKSVYMIADDAARSSKWQPTGTLSVP